MSPAADAFDIIVVGGGHAGIEAAFAAARMGARAALVTLDAKAIGRMSCNPAIGGIGKGQMVRELDALGAEMGHAADASGIQFRLLNTRKGPAVRSPRAQCDKHRYSQYMCSEANSLEGLSIVEGEGAALLLDSGSSASSRVAGLRLADGSELRGHSVILTAGTFLRGLMHCGGKQDKGGRVGEGASYGLSDFLEDLGFQRGRLKTGTPARVDVATVDFSSTTPQPGDEVPSFFSFETGECELEQVDCHIAWTNPEAHEIIRDNLHRAPMYSGQIEGTGPRYCPSIEDKVVRFAEKEKHQVFLEPEGLDTSWIYLNGISTSLPEDVQDRVLGTIPALREANIIQYGYAVEYDFFPPTQIKPTFETHAVEGLYFAGQICGTSGYEEAAAQGFLAGVNAVLRSREQEPFVLDRSEAYIGVLVDDLVKECPVEPYRMFTSRAEYRLLLRSDNADLRLCQKGHQLGLISDERMRRVEAKREQVESLRSALQAAQSDGVSLEKKIRRPGESLEALLEDFPELGSDVEDEVIEQVEIQVKYASYIDRQRLQVERFKRLENLAIPGSFDYRSIIGLRNESIEKLDKIRPLSVGQASRISGVTPADIGVLLAHIDGRRPKKLQDVQGGVAG
ncbi:MAG: tRNA uridine-5-carboxymethylaminomethyl(34) synthesis enzyme MnmG [Planctomycetota bacterium]|nr:tRNA uridine-5-carboxymethylaminomethyl(34) synthesis enzyme MnmG [Planctomycetota bacterium]